VNEKKDMVCLDVKIIIIDNDNYNREVTSNLFSSRTGRRKEIETLINEEALLLAKFLRNERESWIPRIVKLTD